MLKNMHNVDTNSLKWIRLSKSKHEYELRSTEDLVARLFTKGKSATADTVMGSWKFKCILDEGKGTHWIWPWTKCTVNVQDTNTGSIVASFDPCRLNGKVELSLDGHKFRFYGSHSEWRGQNAFDGQFRPLLKFRYCFPSWKQYVLGESWKVARIEVKIDQLTSNALLLILLAGYLIDVWPSNTGD